MFCPLGASLTAIVSNVLKLLMALAVVAAGLVGVRAGLAPRSVTTNTQWGHYLDAGLPEQDVFVERYGAHSNAPDPDFIGARAIFLPNLFRVASTAPLTPSLLAAPLYAASTLVPHDPLQLGSNALGPYYKGEALGLTLGQWLAASGSGTYVQTADRAALRVAFQHLVPAGRYALWCARVSAPPDYSEAEKPCGKSDGSQNRFRADAQGNASLQLEMKALPASTAAVSTVLVLAYERSGDSPDGESGGYGLTSHVQLVYAFPASSGGASDCSGQHKC